MTQVETPGRRVIELGEAMPRSSRNMTFQVRFGQLSDRGNTCILDAAIDLPETIEIAPEVIRLGARQRAVLHITASTS
jgi:hypothetical protein